MAASLGGQQSDAQSPSAQLEARVTELETRLAFQEQSLQTMSDALAALRLEIERGSVLLHQVLAELAQARVPADTNPADELPPHY